MKYDEFEILQEHNVNHQQIHWFPGHMMKTLRLMEKEIKNVDVVIVLLDSRIPYSSQNPEIEQIIKNKNRIYILNKQDLADPEITAKWIRYFRDKGTGAIALNSKTGKNFGSVRAQIEKELKDKPISLGIVLIYINGGNIITNKKEVLGNNFDEFSINQLSAKVIPKSIDRKNNITIEFANESDRYLFRDSIFNENKREEDELEM